MSMCRWRNHLASLASNLVLLERSWTYALGLLAVIFQLLWKHLWRFPCMPRLRDWVIPLCSARRLMWRLWSVSCCVDGSSKTSSAVWALVVLQVASHLSRLWWRQELKTSVDRFSLLFSDTCFQEDPLASPFYLQTCLSYLWMLTAALFALEYSVCYFHSIFCVAWRTVLVRFSCLGTQHLVLGVTWQVDQAFPLMCGVSI